MDVDRNRFLELVVAIGGSAVACTSPETVTAPVIVPAQPPQPAPSTRPGPAPSQTSASAPVASGEPKRGRAAVATYDGPLPKTCASLKCPMPPPWQESFQILKNDCRVLERSLKKEHFERFVGCLLAQNNTRNTCDLTLVSDDPGGCLVGWAEPPALDPTTEAKCRGLVATCGHKFDPAHSRAKTPLTMEVCQGLLSITAPAAERKMVSCITEYCEDGPGLCYLAFDRK